ncbi:crossover junction endodeoxyribonuclease RuvC [bacterium BMS3Abin02]|nr:crossover junction endodeoxyribonuclease RuvC [bacterium BMS3Abin02]GBE21058.1 crossover junction endodeoxyribonuclease RuvC [bacterium BMS3Bbin01]
MQSAGVSGTRVMIVHMFVLGIDPGLTTTGYAVVTAQEVAAIGVIRTQVGLPIPERLLEIYRDVTALIREHAPSVMAIERVFVNRNLQTAMSVVRASGTAMLAAAAAGIPVLEYTPSKVKAAVAGYGNATKGQVQRMVALRMGLAEVPSPPDAADALAVALCHLQEDGLRRRLP